MELRIRSARTTKDIDLTLLEGIRLSKDPVARKQVRAMLQEAAAVGLRDYFEFLIGEAREEFDGAPDGGSRYPVEARAGWDGLYVSKAENEFSNIYLGIYVAIVARRPRRRLFFAKTLRGHKSRRVTMLQDHPHAIHFKHILYFGEGQAWQTNWHMRNVIALGKHCADKCHPHFKVLRLDQTMRLGFMTEENFMITIENELKAMEKNGEA